MIGWCLEIRDVSCPCMNRKKTSRARARSIGLWTKAECARLYKRWHKAALSYHSWTDIFILS